MSVEHDITRRAFLKVSAAAGSGLLISIYLSGCEAATPPDPTATPTAAATATPFPSPTPSPPVLPPDSGGTATSGDRTAVLEPNAFLRIDNTGAVTIILHKTEMGQGVGTSLPMIVAEELEADWSTIRVEQAEADRIYGKTRTAGSDSTYDLFDPLRRAGATARGLLIAAAARIWGIDPESCRAESGAVIHPTSGQQLAYGDLVETAATLAPPAPQLKNPQDYRIIGIPMGRRDNAHIVDGSAIYGLDVQLEGMLYAVVAQSPVFGGRVSSFDASVAEAIPGVRHVIEIASGIAVVADSTWAALQGRAALDVDWDEGHNAGLGSETLRQALLERLGPSGDHPNRREAIYEVPFLAHAPAEPMNCVADVRADRCDVWAPTQNPGAAKDRAVSLGGVPREAVRLSTTLVGGGFGRRLQVDYVGQAVEISRAVGAPVKLTWTREDDIQHDYYHPFTVHRVSAMLDPPSVPSVRTVTFGAQDFPTGAMRAVTNIPDAFVRECFLDELAGEIDRDPYELRMELSGYRSYRKVLELVATKADWYAPLPDGWGRGIACHSTWNVTPVAQVIDASVDQQGHVRVHRVFCAVDCGLVINPDMVEAQMEGGIVFGLTTALKGHITLRDGRVEQSNFHDYPLLTIAEMPEIEVYIVPSEGRPTGVGEMGNPPAAPALLNAIFAATGKRIRHLPVRPEDLRPA